MGMWTLSYGCCPGCLCHSSIYWAKDYDLVQSFSRQQPAWTSHSIEKKGLLRYLAWAKSIFSNVIGNLNPEVNFLSNEKFFFEFMMFSLDVHRSSKPCMLSVQGPDYGRPMKPFFNEIQNVWGLGR